MKTQSMLARHHLLKAILNSCGTSLHVSSPDSSVQQTSQNVPSPDSSVQQTSLNVPSPDSSVQQTGLNVPSPDSSVQQTGLNVPSPDSSVQQTSLNVPSPDSSVQQTSLNVPFPDSSVQQTSLNVPSPDNSVQHCIYYLCAQKINACDPPHLSEVSLTSLLKPDCHHVPPPITSLHQSLNIVVHSDSGNALVRTTPTWKGV